VSELEARRSPTKWWLYYLVAVVLGVYGGTQLFDWVTS
jgi:hypothetical protein